MILSDLEAQVPHALFVSLNQFLAVFLALLNDASVPWLLGLRARATRFQGLLQMFMWSSITFSKELNITYLLLFCGVVCFILSRLGFGHLVRSHVTKFLVVKTLRLTLKARQTLARSRDVESLWPSCTAVNDLCLQKLCKHFACEGGNFKLANQKARYSCETKFKPWREYKGRENWLTMVSAYQSVKSSWILAEEMAHLLPLFISSKRRI